MRKALFSLSFATLFLIDGQSQKNDKLPRLLGEPIIVDTLSTIFFPIRYHEEFLSTNKIAFWGDYYANIVVYDLLNDSYRKLFDKDSYIESFRGAHYYSPELAVRPKNLTSQWVFLLVKNNDYNESGRIDEKDPSVLFAVTATGDNLRALTSENENVISFDIFNKQGFGLVRIQRDGDHDKSFRAEDKDFYYRKINLSDLSTGKAIEIR